MNSIRSALLLGDIVSSFWDLDRFRLGFRVYSSDGCF